MLMEIPISWYMGVEAQGTKTEIFIFCSEKCGLASVDLEH